MVTAYPTRVFPIKMRRAEFSGSRVIRRDFSRVWWHNEADRLPGALPLQWWTPPETPMPITQLIDGRNFGRKREKRGTIAPMRKEREKKGGKKREKRMGKESAVTPTGLLVSNVIYLPCTRIKNLHYCATMLRRRALLPNRDLQLGFSITNPCSDVWRTVIGIVLSLLSRSTFSSIIDHPRGLANMPVIFPPFRISLYYFLPACHGYRQWILHTRKTAWEISKATRNVYHWYLH